MISLLAPAALVLALLVAAAAALEIPGNARAALERPALTAGDRWVYVLQGSLDQFPGLNTSQVSVDLGLSGLVEVDVVGAAQALVGGAEVPGVRVATHTVGFLNGTFTLGGNTTLPASGTFSSDTSEVWEGQADLPTASNSSSSFVVTVTLGITLSAAATVWVNATTSYATPPPFNLSVGESATAPFASDVSVATSASFFGFMNHTENATSLSGAWQRHVLAADNVTVEAGTFPAYRLNESLGSLPGLGIAVPGGGANETAWFSNDVGSFVKRQVFLNGTPVTEMRLKSYTYPATPPGLPLLDLMLLIAVPIALVAVLVFLLLRCRRKGAEAPVTTGTAGRVGDLPPKPPEEGP